MTTQTISVLQDTIEETFSEEELQDVCYRIQIDYDAIAGYEKSAKIHELLLYCNRRKFNKKLLAALGEQRPHVIWPDDYTVPFIATLTVMQSLVTSAYNLSELKRLCTAIGVDYEGLAGDEIQAKTQELLLYCHHHGLKAKLLSTLTKRRPLTTWPDDYTVPLPDPPPPPPPPPPSRYRFLVAIAAAAVVILLVLVVSWLIRDNGGNGQNTNADLTSAAAESDGSVPVTPTSVVSPTETLTQTLNAEDEHAIEASPPATETPTMTPAPFVCAPPHPEISSSATSGILTIVNPGSDGDCYEATQEEITIATSYEDIPADAELWLLVYSAVAGSYYPAPCAAVDEPTGAQECSATLETVGPYDVIVILADASAHADLQDVSGEGVKRDGLPAGIREMDYLSLVRTK